MTTTTAATSTAAAPSTPTTKPSGWGNLGADDFLKMLTAQLKNQAPTSPVDNTQMVAQLAQFSTLSNSTQMSGTLTAIAAKLDTLNGASATNVDIAATLKTISAQLAAIGAAQQAAQAA